MWCFIWHDIHSLSSLYVYVIFTERILVESDVSGPAASLKYLNLYREIKCTWLYCCCPWWVPSRFLWEVFYSWFQMKSCCMVNKCIVGLINAPNWAEWSTWTVWLNASLTKCMFFVEVNDRPVLMAMASKHFPQVTQKTWSSTHSMCISFVFVRNV